MSAINLQEVLIKELKSLFDGQAFLKPRLKDEAAEYVPLNYYSQALPFIDSSDDLPKSDGTDAFYYAPYIMVQVLNGKHDDENEPQEAVVLFNTCIFDDDKANQGHITVLNIIETIQQHLFLKCTFGGKYSVKLPFTWQVNEEDIWPYAVGSAETHWRLPVMAPDNPNI